MMPSFEGNLITQRHQITWLETRDPRLPYGENPESLSHLGLIRYRFVPPASVPAKDFWKSITIWQIYRQARWDVFGTPCTYKNKRIRLTMITFLLHFLRVALSSAQLSPVDCRAYNMLRSGGRPYIIVMLQLQRLRSGRTSSVTYKRKWLTDECSETYGGDRYLIINNRECISEIDHNAVLVSDEMFTTTRCVRRVCRAVVMSRLLLACAAMLLGAVLGKPAVHSCSARSLWK